MEKRGGGVRPVKREALQSRRSRLGAGGNSLRVACVRVCVSSTHTRSTDNDSADDHRHSLPLCLFFSLCRQLWDPPSRLGGGADPKRSAVSRAPVTLASALNRIRRRRRIASDSPPLFASRPQETRPTPRSLPSLALTGSRYLNPEVPGTLFGEACQAVVCVCPPMVPTTCNVN